MKQTIVFVFFLLIPFTAFGVNGSIEYNGEQEILNVWGSNYEMGYAQGYLLNRRIIDFAIDYLFNGLGMTPAEYNYVHSQYWNYFTVPVKYITEAKGLLDGIVDAGYSIYIDTLSRNMDSTDVMIANSIGDISYVFSFLKPFGCSSLSSWGNATIEDTLLNGNIIMGRNLDFTHTEMMLKNALLMTFDPDSGKDWVGFGYSGIISTISGMNEEMLTVEMNMGSRTNTINFNPKLEPFQFTQREILEISDYNGNDTINYRDVFEKCLDSPNAGSWLCHTIVPYIDSATISAAVIECVNESGDTFRIAENDTNFRPWNLLLLNHEEVNYTPLPDPRYDIVLDSINADSSITTERMFNIMRAVSWINTIQTMLFLPNDSMIAISFADSVNNSANKTPYWYKWSDLFPNHSPGVEETKAKKRGKVVLLYSDFIGLLKKENVTIYNISGRKINPAEISGMSSGIYFIRRKNPPRIHKLLILR
ncbi:MAG: hypothetical protein E3J87_05545 [Candidatus Cloacimonadota bacterium]|nr:MAG: hypothetical protein E3J87_05545 [Candidatus Cloacimonadota bacterium]